MDLGAACAGFVTGLHAGASMAIACDSPQLLVSSEIRSKFLNPGDFNTSVLFGDGAAACAIDASSAKGAEFRLLGTELASDGSVFDLIAIPSGGSRKPFRDGTPGAEACLKMGDGAAVFLKAVHAMTEIPSRLLGRLGLGFDDVRWIVPHQANLLLLKEIGKRIPGADSKIVETVSWTGNTSGASVGIALSTLLEKPELKKGDRVVLASAGGGGLAASAVLERV
jgi:3-oxoacyl-[acyl-carrier-protein] synthase-3